MTAKRILFPLATLCGALAALGHAPFGFWPLALVGFAGLVWLVANGARPGWTGWFGAVGYFGVAMHWIVEPFLVDIQTHGWMAPFALILLAGGLALFWGAAARGAAYLGTTPQTRAMAFGAALTIAELVRGHIFTGFPWALPAYIWAETPMRGAAAFVGSYGLSFLTFLGAACLAMPFGRGGGMIAAAALFGGVFALGNHQIDNAATDRPSLGTVRIVQPNVPQAEKWDREKIPGHFNRMLDLTKTVSDARTDLVIWPEVAVVWPLDLASEALIQAIRAVVTGTTSETRLITGINRRDAAGNWYNALAVVGPGADVQETYDKVHLVPFGEYIPFRIEFLRAMAATSGFGFTPGAEVRAIGTPLGRALPLICYEGIFPGHIFRADERPDYLLQLTNDAWFGTFSGPFQHLDQARFRAVEQGLSLVRAANTGVSTVIDPAGNLSDHLELGRAGVLDLPVPAPLSPTIYAQTGDLPLLVILFLTLSGLITLKRRNAIANGGTTS